MKIKYYLEKIIYKNALYYNQVIVSFKISKLFCKKISKLNLYKKLKELVVIFVFMLIVLNKSIKKTLEFQYLYI